MARPDKVRTVEDSIATVANGATVGVTGFRWAGSPESLLRSLGQRFLDTGAPRGLTVVFSSAQGDQAQTGLEHLAQTGLLARVIGGFWGISPTLCGMAQREEIEAYNLPQGQICQLYRAIAAGQPGFVSRIGLNTYIDPRQTGGRLNKRAVEPLIDLVRLRDQDWLLYRAFPVDVALIRATTADENGNLSMEMEAVTTEALALACAAHNSGGRVIAQVRRVVPAGTLHPRQVAVPGHLVDHVVQADDPARDHRQCVRSVHDPALTGDRLDEAGLLAPVPALVRRIVANRAALELRDGDIVNLGQGIPTDIATLLREQRAPPAITLTIESGVVGGRPEPPPDFGISVNPEAILRQDDQFMFYDGGGLDAAFLGFAEIDRAGNVNVSRFGGRLVGCGGFLDVAQTAKRLVLCGSLTAGALELSLDGGSLRIVREGRVRKLVSQVAEITFSPADSLARGRPVTIVTDRCVISVTAEGLRLMEVAPGLDVRRDILDHVEFPLLINDRVAPMAMPSMHGVGT